MRNVKLLIPIFILVSLGQAPSLQVPPGTYTASVTLATPGSVSLPTPYSGPAGTYMFVSTVPVTISKTDSSYTLSWTPEPTPPPPVPPNPPPNPVPVVAPLFTFAIFDAKGSATTDQLAAQTSKTLGPALTALTSQWVAADISSPAFTEWIPEIAKAKLTPPVLFVVTLNPSGTGALLPGYPIALASKDTENFVVVEIRKLRGK